MDNNKLPKRDRLSGRKRIETLFAEGSGGFVYPFKYIFSVKTAQPGEGGVCMMVSVPKKNHKRAVARNKLKRRTREAFRLSRHGLQLNASDSACKIDLALVYVSKEKEEYGKIESATVKILAEISGKYKSLG